ncbi:hypothetical protein B296_00034804, partial [Ensete ventricosum]
MSCQEPWELRFELIFISPGRAYYFIGISMLLSPHLDFLTHSSRDILILCPAGEVCLTPSRWQVGRSSETLVM